MQAEALYVFGGDGSAVDGSGLALLPQCEGVTIRDELGQPAQLTLTVRANAPLATALGTDSLPLLSAQRLVRLAFSSVTRHEEFRITKVHRTLDGSGSLTAEGTSAKTDLAFYPVYRTVAGRRAPGYPITGLTLTAALTALLDGSSGPAGVFAFGSVATSLSSFVVDVPMRPEQNRLELLLELAEQAGGEIEIRPTGTSGNRLTYAVHIVEEAGRSAHEITAGAAVPARRPFHLGGSSASRIEASAESEGAQVFTTLLPLSRAEAEQDDFNASVARALWTCQGAAYQAGSNTTILTLGGNPLRADDRCGPAVQLASGGTVYAVVDADAPEYVTVAGNASGLNGQRVRFCEGDGSDLLVLKYRGFNPASPGSWAANPEGDLLRIESFDVGPSENLLATVASCDMSGWSGGLPIGVTKIAVSGNPTVTQVTDGLYNRHGTSSMKVVCTEVGQGVKIGPFTCAPTDFERYLSVWTSAMLDAGRVRLDLIKPDGTAFDFGTIPTSSARELRELLAEGADGTAGSWYVHMTAAEAATTFYLDAITVTATAKAMPYQPAMGPTALWKLAWDLLLSEGGPNGTALEGLVLDLSTIGTASIDEVLIGSWMEVYEDGIPGAAGANASRIVGAARVVNLDRTYGPDGNCFFREVKLGTPRPTVLGRFDDVLSRRRIGEARRDLLETVTLHVAETGRTSTTQSNEVRMVGMTGLPFVLKRQIVGGATTTVGTFSAVASTTDVVTLGMNAQTAVYWAERLGALVSAKASIQLHPSDATVSHTETITSAGGLDKHVFVFTLNKQLAGSTWTARVEEGTVDPQDSEKMPQSGACGQLTSFTFTVYTTAGQTIDLGFYVYDKDGYLIGWRIT